MLTAFPGSNHAESPGLRSARIANVEYIKRAQQLHGALTAFAVAGALSAAGCGEEDAVNQAQDEIQREAEDFTQGIPDDARDVQQQAEDAAQDVQDQIDDLTNEGN